MPNPDRLTALDAIVPAPRGRQRRAPCTSASCMLFEGDDPALRRLPRGDREPSAPRPPLPPAAGVRSRCGQGRPVWVDDPHFNARYHVRHTALPRPGSEQQLKHLAGRVFSQQLDRDKPLWEIWLVGQARGRPVRDAGQDPPRARGRDLGRRHHHRAVRRLARRPRPSPPERPWVPRPLPSDAQLLGEALIERATCRPRSCAACAPCSAARAGCSARGRGRRRGRRARLGRADPGSAHAAERADLARTAASTWVEADLDALQGDQERRSAARSTTSCSARSRWRSAAACATAASTVDDLDAEGDGAGLGAGGRRARRARQQGRRDVGAAAGLERGPGGDASRSCTPRWASSRSPARPSARPC